MGLCLANIYLAFFQGTSNRLVNWWRLSAVRWIISVVSSHTVTFCSSRADFSFQPGSDASLIFTQSFMGRAPCHRRSSDFSHPAIYRCRLCSVDWWCPLDGCMSKVRTNVFDDASVCSKVLTDHRDLLSRRHVRGRVMHHEARYSAFLWPQSTTANTDLPKEWSIGPD